MSETDAVKEARAWRKQVYEQTKDLSPADLRAREEELLQQARQAGIEFEDILASVPTRTPR